MPCRRASRKNCFASAAGRRRVSVRSSRASVLDGDVEMEDVPAGVEPVVERDQQHDVILGKQPGDAAPQVAASSKAGRNSPSRAQAWSSSAGPRQ